MVRKINQENNKIMKKKIIPLLLIYFIVLSCSDNNFEEFNSSLISTRNSSSVNNTTKLRYSVINGAHNSSTCFAASVRVIGTGFNITTNGNVPEVSGAIIDNPTISPDRKVFVTARVEIHPNECDREHSLTVWSSGGFSKTYKFSSGQNMLIIGESIPIGNQQMETIAFTYNRVNH